MNDYLKQIEKRYGSVTEYNRSIDDDKAHEAALGQQKPKYCSPNTEVETSKCNTDIDDNDLPF